MPKNDSRRTKRGGAVPAGGTEAEPGAAPVLPERIWLGLLLVIAALLFAPSVANEFTFDDLDVIAENEVLDRPGDLGLFLTTPWWRDDPETRIYRPLAVATLAWDRALLGADPFGVHLVNLLLNVGVAWLVFRLARALGLGAFGAFATGLLFAVHPVHVEVVSTGVGRADLLAAVFLLGGALLHLRWQRASLAGERGPRTWTALGGASALYFLGLLSKESVAVLPGLLFVQEWLLVHRGRPAPVLKRAHLYFAYAPALLLFLVLRHSVVGAGLPSVQEVMQGADGLGRALYASETLLRELGQLVCPLSFAADYSNYEALVRPGLSDPLVLLSLVVWPLLFVLGRRLVRGGRTVPALGLAWFFLAILPFSNLFFPIGTVRAERLLFVPSFGLALLAGWALERWGARNRWAALLALGVVAGLYGAQSLRRQADWRTVAAFDRAFLRDNPGSPLAWHAAGRSAREAGDLDEAERCYRIAIELRGRVGVLHAEATAGLALVEQARGRPEEAERLYRQVVEAYSDDFLSRLNLGEMLLSRPEDLEEAALLLERAWRLRPEDFRAPANLCQAWQALGRDEDALEAIEAAVALRPDIPDLHLVQAEVLERLGRDEEAARARAAGEARR